MDPSKEIYVEALEAEVVTLGLKSILGREFRLMVGNHEEDDYKHVLNYIVDYISKESPSIQANQTIAYYSWLLKFIVQDEFYFTVFEADKDGGDFMEGAEYAIGVNKSQLEICSENQVLPDFPSFGQKIAISKGVLSGLPVQAVRYKAPSHMTGWYLTTELYTGDVNDLNVIYFHDLAFKRPNLIRLLALPVGFRFGTNDLEDDVWFDEEVAAEIV